MRSSLVPGGLLTLERHHGQAGDRVSVPWTEWRIDKGRRPVRLFADRAGFSPARMSPMWAAARVPLSNLLRPW